MRVTFLLPGPAPRPIGGFKVVYEYANGLAARGHAITLLHPARLETDASVSTRLRRSARFVIERLAGGPSPRSWFDLDPAIRSRWVPSLSPRHVPESDAVVATAWQTAEWAAAYPDAKGRKFYFIQHLETWAGPEERVLATWRLPLNKIVISRWLQEVGERQGETSIHIPNGLDLDAFGVDVPPEDRNPRAVMMLYHDLPWKGSRDGLAALEQVRRSHPDLEITLFGTPSRPELPPEIRYVQDPHQQRLRTLYNEAAIFVAPSLSEGWGLPPAESMLSGCALAATDIGGHRDYAERDRTALFSPPEDPQALAVNVRRLVEDDALRLRLAREGARCIRAFTWERAVGAMERALSAEQPADV
jgi:glycosyltransferase involved in cell wall biosynthesis